MAFVADRQRRTYYPFVLTTYNLGTVIKVQD